MANIRPLVIVSLNCERPQNAPREPPVIVWNEVKERELRESAAPHRQSGKQEADWVLLAQRLEIPLPFLLAKVRHSYEEDLRRLQDVRSLSRGTPRRVVSATGAPHLELRPDSFVSTASPRANVDRPKSLPSSSSNGSEEGSDSVEETKDEAEELAKRLKGLRAAMSPATLAFARGSTSSQSAANAPVMRPTVPARGVNATSPGGRQKLSSSEDTREEDRASSVPRRERPRGSPGYLDTDSAKSTERSSDPDADTSLASSYSNISEASISASALEAAALSRSGSRHLSRHE